MLSLLAPAWKSAHGLWSKILILTSQIKNLHKLLATSFHSKPIYWMPCTCNFSLMVLGGYIYIWTKNLSSWRKYFNSFAAQAHSKSSPSSIPMTRWHLFLQQFVILIWGYVYWFWRGEGREREKWQRDRERNVDTLIGCPTMRLDQKLNPHPRYVPWPGVQPETFWCRDDSPTNWATSSGLFQSFLIEKLHFENSTKVRNSLLWGLPFKGLKGLKGEMFIPHCCVSLEAENSSPLE